MGDIPAQIGRYTVAQKLGAGGMGEVFLAYSPAGSPVAVKVIRSDRLDASTRARFEREALIARTVIGTNRVARFLDADPYADRPWLAMEYVPGRTLLKHVDECGALPLSLVASLGALLCEGMEAVHAVGLLHRDLKPQNIILGTDGPMIIDFGLAALVDAPHDSLSHSGMIIGTVRCMPPEQAGGHPHVTPAADVYALGTVLLYAAAGHYPYDGVRWEAIVANVVNPQTGPDLSGVSSGLKPLLTAMLAHEPQARPTVADVAAACAALLAGMGVTPADARLALIARSAGATADKAGPSLSPSVEARLEALNLLNDATALESPLDVPPGLGDEAAEPDSPPKADEEPTKDTVRAKQRPVRLAASRRVADELRTAYAARSAL
ncbi:serine/threonine-protein kinase [Dactylosporangium sp. CS-047395]|uniref:serine/threonine-protein kinase n=1 Tax=Dactylosporangium sp. CS-047395 TaxID=3239936 RepID=UPI003D8E45CB